MTVFRTEKTKNYTVMSILHLRDKRLSFKANHDLKKGAYSRVINLLNDGDVDDDL